MADTCGSADPCSACSFGTCIWLRTRLLGRLRIWVALGKSQASRLFVWLCGLAVFDLIRHKRHGDDAVLIAFDLIELDGEDLRRTPIELRKRSLAKLMRRASFATSSKRPAA
jgi:hypothetical protein